MADYRPYLQEISPDTYELSYDGKTVFAFYTGGTAIPKHLVDRAVTEAARQLPGDWYKGVKVFCLPYRLIDKDQNGWFSSYYTGQAFPNHIVLSCQMDPDDYTVRVIIHELAGHIFTYRLIDPNPFDLKDTEAYRKFKELFSIETTDKAPWVLRPSEIFAEMMVELCGYKSELFKVGYDKEKFKTFVLERLQAGQ